MKLSTENLILSSDDFIDLQLHTENSDGKWTAETLIDYLIAEGFALAAITDHDRADIALDLQKIALEKQFPLLVALEISSMWKGQLVDFLCYGFNPEDNALLAITEDVVQRQYANTKHIVETLRNKGYPFTNEEVDIALSKPSSQQVTELVAMVTNHEKEGEPIGKTLLEAGFAYETVSPSKIVRAAHESKAICLLAHPGRDDGFTCFDEALLDELRAEAPIDGIEAYYPKHSTEQTQIYLEYAQKHNLIVSSGSDSHSAEHPPIKYKAELSRQLLERLGISIE